MGTFKAIRAYLTLEIVMIPYACGYILHFMLANFRAVEDVERPEGCNAVSAVISDLMRFLSFVFVVSLSLKIDSRTDVTYDWQATMWPFWGLEGLLIILVLLASSVCLVAVMDRPKLLMLTW